MKNILKKIYYRLFDNLITELRKGVGNSESLLDVGCGKYSPAAELSNKIYKVGVDIYKPDLETSKKNKTHQKYYLMNILEMDKKIKPKSYDCVMAIDVIEHLEKKDGEKLIKIMETIARKKVIFFTPNGFLPQGAHEGNPWQVHRSGWSAKEMQQRGYNVIGINGWKPLRGESANVKYWPRHLWILISDITQLFVRNKPEYAYQILCIKTIK